MKPTCAQTIVETLKSLGITTIFGYPGAGNAALFDALRDSEVKLILPRSEQAAAHQASGYGIVTGTVGVCTATSGPGATNLLTGIATAYMDSIPMVAITGQVPTYQIGNDAFQEVDIIGASMPFTKHNYLLTNPDDTARVVKEAFHIASTGRPGPVLIDVPMDVFRADFNGEIPKTVTMRGYKPTVRGHSLQIKKLHQMLKVAKMPVIMAGGGVSASGAGEQVAKFARKLNAPIVTTLMGLASVPYYGDNHIGMLGLHGHKPANKAILEADTIIVIGARFNDRAYAHPKGFEDTKIIHIDIDPAEIGKCVGVHLPIVGDVKTVMEQILKDMDQYEITDFAKELIEENKKGRDYKFKKDVINPKYAMNMLSKMVPDDAILTTEVGQNQLWAATNYKAPKKGRFITSGGLGTMGYGLPAAIGAKIGAPDSTVIAVEGDGSLQMMLPEFATMRQWGAPLKIILFRNDWLGLVREYQKVFFESRYHGVSIDGSPDFVELAKVYDIPGERVTDNDGLEAAFKRMLDAEGSYLLELVVDKDESTL